MQPYFVNERLQQAQQFDQTCVTLVTNILFAWFLFAFSGLPDFFLVTRQIVSEGGFRSPTFLCLFFSQIRLKLRNLRLDGLFPV